MKVRPMRWPQSLKLSIRRSGGWVRPRLSLATHCDVGNDVGNDAGNDGGNDAGAWQSILTFIYIYVLYTHTYKHMHSLH